MDSDTFINYVNNDNKNCFIRNVNDINEKKEMSNKIFMNNLDLALRYPNIEHYFSINTEISNELNNFINEKLNIANIKIFNFSNDIDNNNITIIPDTDNVYYVKYDNKNKYLYINNHGNIIENPINMS